VDPEILTPEALQADGSWAERANTPKNALATFRIVEAVAKR